MNIMGGDTTVWTLGLLLLWGHWDGVKRLSHPHVMDGMGVCKNETCNGKIEIR